MLTKLDLEYKLKIMGYNIGGNTLDASMLTLDGNILSKGFRRVHYDMVDTINYSGSYAVNAVGNDGNGNFYLNFQHQNSGCDNSGFAVKIKSVYNWSYLICKFYCEGYAACWNFNADGYSPSSGMLTWSGAAGDQLFDSVNAFEYPQFTKQSNACDNDPTNFMHGGYAVSGSRSFWMLSRRNGTLSAGPTHGRACNNPAVTIVSDIYIF
jgi:hypothetical protein